uniref:Response regulatory domain-containing protein n=1 Tax=Acidobacterium capsulatum TaxID=33075 RepID=A0A7V5CSK9_9BACT
MPRKNPSKKPVSAIPLLLVGSDSAELDRKTALLSSHGYVVTRAENICYAEMFAAEQYFEAAVYDSSLDTQEQISLARIMRVRWPWMRLVRCGPMPAHADPDLFDAWSLSEERLPQDVESTLVF